MIRVILIEDHELVRDGLASLIAAQPGFEVVGSAGLARSGTTLCERLKPDVVVLDYCLPDLDGFEAARQILAASPSSRILVVSWCENADIARRMMALGAAGYVVKTAPSSELVTALRKVASGHHHVSLPVMEAMLEGQWAPADQPPEAVLTEREIQVLRAIGNGLGPAEIAQTLSIASSTADTHRARLKAKLGLHSTADIIRFAIRRGLVELGP